MLTDQKEKLGVIPIPTQQQQMRVLKQKRVGIGVRKSEPGIFPPHGTFLRFPHNKTAG
jgi:hypothetical protein